MCPACGVDSPPGARFCGSCGTALGGVRCTSCGAPSPETNRFCGQCGAALAQGQQALPLAGVGVDERKLATVLFADVVGFTSLAEDSDPETVARMVDGAFRRMARVVSDHGGTVDKYLGDCLMAVFGVPAAHDDDAERAVAAALAMRELGGDLAFSIGINTGEVMVTSVGRDGDVTVIGDAVNVAARLEKAAGPGEVLVGPTTAELAGARVAFRERQPILLKGKREPLAVCEALGMRTAPESLGPEGPPLVGRDDELAFLRSQWRRVLRDGRPAVVLVTGGAGLGKTRLLEELVSETAAEGRAVVATYPAYGGLGGPRVAAELIRQLGSSGDPAVDARVRSITGDLHPSLQSLDHHAMKQEQVWAFRRLFEQKASEQPLLVAIDDIHRSTDKTIDLVSELMSRVGDIPVLTVLAGRPDPPEWLSRFPSATTIRLDPISPDHSLALAATLVPEGRLGDDAARFFVARAGGNPLYLRELVATVRRQGLLVEEGDALRVVEGATLPPSLQAILAARLDALQPAEKSALQYVAILGDASGPEQVAALGLSSAEAALSSLVAQGLLRHRRDGALEVTDPLLREVAYETLPRNVRGERHRRAAMVIADPVESARHFDRATTYLPDDAELGREAADALLRAGTELISASRPADAIAFLERALDLGCDDPQAVLRLASMLNVVQRSEEAREVLGRLHRDDVDPAVVAEAVHLEAASHMFVTPARSLDLFDDATRRWREIGNLTKEGWAAANKGVSLFNLGRMREAGDSLDTAVERFRAAGDKAGELAAYSFLALVRPDDPEVPRWLGEALRHAEESGDRSGQVGALTSLAWHHCLRVRLGGDEDVVVAETYAKRLSDVASEIGAPTMTAHGLCIRSHLARGAGRLDEALALARQAEALPNVEHSDAVLVRAVRFAADIALQPDADLAAPNESPSPDPVAAVALVIVIEALTLAGRLDDVATRVDAPFGTPGMGSLEHHITGLVEGLYRVLEGSHALAIGPLEVAARHAEGLQTRPGLAAASALLAEAFALSGDADGAARVLASVPEPVPGGVAGALVARARSVLGDAQAAADLAAAVERLGAPGLAL